MTLHHSAERIADTLERERTVTIHEVDYSDPYITDSFQSVNEYVDRIAQEGMAYYGNSAPDRSRERPKNVDRIHNTVTRQLLADLPTFSDWLDLVPTAAALDCLYNPTTPALQNGAPIHPEFSQWLRNIADGRGIRSRAAVLEGLIAQETMRHDRPVEWLSLASGAAQPIVNAAHQLKEIHGVTPHMTLVDIDRTALSLARTYANEAGVGDHLTIQPMNILNPAGLTRESTLEEAPIKKGLPAASFDVVDAVGLLEYLKLDDLQKEYEYGDVIKTRTAMAGARTFLKNAYELVRPGGVLVVGNMLDTHPQLGFTLDVIQWPHIQPRSIDEMTELFHEAGVDDEVDAYCPSDGAYAVYQLRKPEE